jgi:hypothetical protein
VPRAADSLGAEEEPLRGFGGNCDGPRDLTWVVSPLSKSRSDLKRVGELQKRASQGPFVFVAVLPSRFRLGGRWPRLNTRSWLIASPPSQEKTAGSWPLLPMTSIGASERASERATRDGGAGGGG